MPYSPRDFHACTKTISIIDKGAYTIRVTNTAKMNVGDMILIDYMFCYRNKYLETNIIESIIDQNVITLKKEVLMRHPNCVNVMCIDTMPRKQLVLTQQSLFSAPSEEPISESDSSVDCFSSEHCSSPLDGSSSVSCSLSDHCSSSIHGSSSESGSSSDHSLTSDEETIEDVSQITIHKVKHEHDHTGLFSNNIIKLS